MWPIEVSGSYLDWPLFREATHRGSARAKYKPLRYRARDGRAANDPPGSSTNKKSPAAAATGQDRSEHERNSRPLGECEMNAALRLSSVPAPHSPPRQG